MDFTAGTFFAGHFAMGIFALYVVVVSLVRIMADREFIRLTQMKQVWGRKRGLLFHFVSNVALPLVCGVVFLSSGITGIGQGLRPWAAGQSDQFTSDQDDSTEAFLQAFADPLLESKGVAGPEHDLFMP